MTHCDRVLDYMRRKGSISQKEAADAFGCERLSGRIYDLKRMGYRIVTTFDTKPNRFGDMTRFARYYLITEEKDHGTTTKEGSGQRL